MNSTTHRGIRASWVSRVILAPSATRLAAAALCCARCKFHALVYEGPAKVQTYGGIAQQSAASATGDTSNLGGVVPVWSLRLDLPISVVGVRSGDIAIVVASRDAALAGARLRLINLQSEKTYATARRWNVQEIPHDGGGDAP